MPNISVVREHLFEAIGRRYTEAEFDDLCFQFGVEVDDVVTEMIEVQYFDNLTLSVLISPIFQYADGTKQEHVVYVIAIPANRYDLLCLEGFGRALKIFLDAAKPPVSSCLCCPKSLVFIILHDRFIKLFQQLHLIW